MAIKFDCVHCNQHISTDISAAGKQGKCPSCGKPVRVPAEQRNPTVAQSVSETIFCQKCGTKNLENNFKCTKCGFVLHGPVQPQNVVSENSALGGLIPYKNPKALWAYYLGVFSLIPCIGIPLGIAALVLGLKGLQFAKLHPEALGKGHAWTGVILGSICALAYTILIAVPMMMGSF